MHAIFELLERSPRPLLIIGGHALAVHGVARQTMDVDCMITAEDAPALEAHLRTAGFSPLGQTQLMAQYAHPSDLIPDIDVLFVDASTFAKLHAEAIPLRPDSTRLRAPSLAHFIALKLHAVRNQPSREASDFGDIARLLQANPDALDADEFATLCAQFGPSDAATKLQALRPMS